jgi:hypothetical protein
LPVSAAGYGTPPAAEQRRQHQPDEQSAAAPDPRRRTAKTDSQNPVGQEGSKKENIGELLDPKLDTSRN